MKRKVIKIGVICVSFILIVAINLGLKFNNVIIKNRGTDYTLTAKNSFKKSSLKNRKISKILEEYDSDGLTKLYQITNLADEVVEYEVIDVNFVNQDGNAFNYTDILIKDVLKGDLKKGDKITIINYGGYILANEFYEKDKLLNEKFPNKKFKKDEYYKIEDEDNPIPQIGQKGIWCLQKNLYGTKYYIEGSYDIMPFADLREQKNGKFKRINFNDEKLYTKDELLKITKYDDGIYNVDDFEIEWRKKEVEKSKLNKKKNKQ